MIPAARAAAAIEVLSDISARRRPASDALKDWGLAHRFAGSGDRANIASLVFDALRRQSSAHWIMQEETPRASMLGALALMRGLGTDAIAALFNGEGHAPPVLSAAERAHLDARKLDDAPAHVRGDFPEWLAAPFAAAFGAHVAEEAQALATRAPLDLRVNILKGDREKALKALAHLSAEPCALSPLGLTIPLNAEGRSAALGAEPAYVKGLVEIQDEGSQLAAFAAGAQPGMQVLDLCAGGGGKALALAGFMHNKGQLYASDGDGRRLMPIFPRLERANVRNIQVRAPRKGTDVLADLSARCDIVFVDAPCTGTGTWRRNPDAKWRMRPGALEQRVKEQDEVLAGAARFVKPGGRILYVTCSVLIEENEARVAAFLAVHPGFSAVAADDLARTAMLPDLARFASPHGPGLRLSPLSAGTDGFYMCGIRKVAISE